MKYSWDIKSIEKKLSIVKQSENSSAYVKQIIYSNMLADIGVIVPNTKQRISKELFFSKLKNFDLSYFDHHFFKMIKYISSCLDYTSYDIESSCIEKKTPEEVIKNCIAFYKTTDKSSLGYFKKITTNKSAFHFMNYKSDKSFIGRSYIPSLDEFYILINGRNYLEDLVSTIHECKHVEMFIKGYNNGIKLYQELAPNLYEMYAIDYLEKNDENSESVKILKLQNINKYVKMIKRFCEQIDFIIKLINDEVFWNNIYENYDIYYEEYNLEYIYKILCNGYSELEIGTIISFIVSMDIYINGNINNINNVISCYMFGLYNLKPNIIDNIANYINNMFNIPGEKLKKHIK